MPACSEPAAAETAANEEAAASVPAGWTSARVPDLPAGAAIVTTRSVSCPTGFVCLFQNSNRGGVALALRSGYGLRNLKGVPCGSCRNGIHGNDGTFNDQMSSWENRSGRRYCWYWDVGPAGESHTMPNGQIINVLPRENDRASALWPC